MYTKQIRTKSKIKIMNTHYSFKCDTCKEKHTLMKTTPIQLRCIKHDDHESAKSWNRSFAPIAFAIKLVEIQDSYGFATIVPCTHLIR